MTDERQAAIRELMRAAERVFDVCGHEALDEAPSLAAQIVEFCMTEGSRIRVVVELTASHAGVTGEMVRDAAEGRLERLAFFELLAAPADGLDRALH